MGHNDLKEYTVKVGNGSGCLFQPMDEEHTYILTAKHLFQKGLDAGAERHYVEDGTEEKIIFLKFDGDSWAEKSITFTVNRNENFFPHANEEVDAAILKIPYREGYNDIHISNSVGNTTFYLCGFPGELNPQKEVGDNYIPYTVEGFKQSGNYFNVAKLDSFLAEVDIKGMSGGGILTYDKSHILITGIQSRMATKVDYPLGEIGYVPIRYFEQIIEQHRVDGKLVELLPIFLKSFVSLIGDTFQMGKSPLYQKEEILSERLRNKAKFLITSDLTPIEIRKFLSDKCLLIAGQDSLELKRKKIWTLWLELLVFLNIAKDKTHKIQDLDNLMRKFRFFYSDTHDDFIEVHLQNLWKIDYTGLDDDGVVVFSNNSQHLSDEAKGFMDLSTILPNIGIARIKYEGMNIDQSLKFPFDNFKYISLSNFKKYTATKLDSSFITMNADDCYLLLKKLYEKLLP